MAEETVEVKEEAAQAPVEVDLDSKIAAAVQAALEKLQPAAPAQPAQPAQPAAENTENTESTENTDLRKAAQEIEALTQRAELAEAKLTLTERGIKQGYMQDVLNLYKASNSTDLGKFINGMKVRYPIWFESEPKSTGTPLAPAAAAATPQEDPGSLGARLAKMRRGQT